MCCARPPCLHLITRRSAWRDRRRLLRNSACVRVCGIPVHSRKLCPSASLLKARYHVRPALPRIGDALRRGPAPFVGDRIPFGAMCRCLGFLCSGARKVYKAAILSMGPTVQHLTSKQHLLHTVRSTFAHRCSTAEFQALSAVSAHTNGRIQLQQCLRPCFRCLCRPRGHCKSVSVPLLSLANLGKDGHAGLPEMQKTSSSRREPQWHLHPRGPSVDTSKSGIVRTVHRNVDLEDHFVIAPLAYILLLSASVPLSLSHI